MWKKTMASSSKMHSKYFYQHTILLECIMSSNKSSDVCKTWWSKSRMMRGWGVQYSVDGLLRLLKTLYVVRMEVVGKVRTKSRESRRQSTVGYSFTPVMPQ